MINSLKKGNITLDVVYADGPSLEEMSIMVYEGDKKDSTPKFKVRVTVGEKETGHGRCPCIKYVVE